MLTMISTKIHFSYILFDLQQLAKQCIVHVILQPWNKTIAFDWQPDELLTLGDLNVTNTNFHTEYTYYYCTENYMKGNIYEQCQLLMKSYTIIQIHVLCHPLKQHQLSSKLSSN